MCIYHEVDYPVKHNICFSQCFNNIPIKLKLPTRTHQCKGRTYLIIFHILHVGKYYKMENINIPNDEQL